MCGLFGGREGGRGVRKKREICIITIIIIISNCFYHLFMQQVHLEQTVKQSYSSNATFIATCISSTSHMDYKCSKRTRNDINVAIIIEAKMTSNNKFHYAVAQVIYK